MNIDLIYLFVGEIAIILIMYRFMLRQWIVQHWDEKLQEEGWLIFRLEPVIDEIEDRKKLMNLLTKTKNEKGIVDVVKFNYGKNKIGPSTQVVPIDKLDEMGKFNLQDFVVRGENYLQGFEAASKKAPVLMQDGKITTKKFKGKELQDLIAAIACPGKAMGGRIGFQDGTS